MLFLLILLGRLLLLDLIVEKLVAQIEVVLSYLGRLRSGLLDKLILFFDLHLERLKLDSQLLKKLLMLLTILCLLLLLLLRYLRLLFVHVRV